MSTAWACVYLVLIHTKVPHGLAVGTCVCCPWLGITPVLAGPFAAPRDSSDSYSSPGSNQVSASLHWIPGQGQASRWASKAQKRQGQGGPHGGPVPVGGFRGNSVFCTVEALLASGCLAALGPCPSMPVVDRRMGAYPLLSEASSQAASLAGSTNVC